MMGRYFVYSSFGHGLFFVVCLSLGALLSRPRMSYYAVDLFMSAPAGPSGAGVSVPVEATKPVALPSPTVEQKQPPPLKESIRVKGKVKPQPHAVPVKRKLKLTI